MQTPIHGIFRLFPSSQLVTEFHLHNQVNQLRFKFPDKFQLCFWEREKGKICRN